MRTAVLTTFVALFSGLVVLAPAWGATVGGVQDANQRLEVLELELRQVELAIFDTSDPTQREALDARRAEIIAELDDFAEQAGAQPAPPGPPGTKAPPQQVAGPPEPVPAADAGPAPGVNGDRVAGSLLLPAMAAVVAGALAVGLVGLVGRQRATPAAAISAARRLPLRQPVEAARIALARVRLPSRRPAETARAIAARMPRPSRARTKQAWPGNGALLPLLGVLGGAGVGVGVALAPVVTVAAVVVLFGVVLMLVPRR